MALTSIQTDRAPSAIGPYSQAVRVDKWLFVSGQLGLEPVTGRLAGDGLVEQTRQALENMHHILDAGDLDFMSGRGGCLPAGYRSVWYF